MVADENGLKISGMMESANTGPIKQKASEKEKGYSFPQYYSRK
jgi:hypothetical protein